MHSFLNGGEQGEGGLLCTRYSKEKQYAQPTLSVWCQVDAESLIPTPSFYGQQEKLGKFENLIIGQNLAQMRMGLAQGYVHKPFAAPS